MERVDTIKDDVFIQPVVITVKKDRSGKIALDARALNDSIAKDKYQMPNLENLLDMVAEKNRRKRGPSFLFVCRYEVCIRTNSARLKYGKTL